MYVMGPRPLNVVLLLQCVNKLSDVYTLTSSLLCLNGIPLLSLADRADSDTIGASSGQTSQQYGILVCHDRSHMGDIRTCDTTVHDLCE